MRVHTGEKSFRCDQCDYSSAHGTTFTNHMMTHYNLRPFHCGTCRYSSTTKQKVQRHIITRPACRDAHIIHHKDIKVDLSRYRVKKNNVPQVGILNPSRLITTYSYTITLYTTRISRSTCRGIGSRKTTCPRSVY